jgi:hypothetical protein
LTANTAWHSMHLSAPVPNTEPSPSVFHCIRVGAEAPWLHGVGLRGGTNNGDSPRAAGSSGSRQRTSSVCIPGGGPPSSASLPVALPVPLQVGCLSATPLRHHPHVAPLRRRPFAAARLPIHRQPASLPFTADPAPLPSITCPSIAPPPEQEESKPVGRATARGAALPLPCLSSLRDEPDCCSPASLLWVSSLQE